MKKFRLKKIKQTSELMTDWKFASLIEVNKEFRVEGLNIWNHYWHCNDRKVEVKGPFEGHVYFFKEYCITYDDKSVRFVAGEFSNGQIGLYIKDDLADKKI